MGWGHRTKHAPNVACAEGGRAFHGDESEKLHEMVLDNVPDDTELVEVAATTLCPERLLQTPQRS